MTQATQEEQLKKLTSDANARRFLSPPEIPTVFPGVPILVFAQLVRPS